MLVLQRNNVNHVLIHWAGAKNADNLALAGKVIIQDLSWYIPHYTPNISNQKLMLGHIVSKAPNEISFNKRSSFVKDVTTENNWTTGPLSRALDMVLINSINNIKLMIHLIDQV